MRKERITFTTSQLNCCITLQQHRGHFSIYLKLKLNNNYYTFTNKTRIISTHTCIKRFFQNLFDVLWRPIFSSLKKMARSTTRRKITQKQNATLQTFANRTADFNEDLRLSCLLGIFVGHSLIITLTTPTFIDDPNVRHTNAHEPASATNRQKRI